MSKRESNIEFVTRVMDFSRHGALMQIFVMDALQKHADRIAAIDPNELPTNSMIHPFAWVGTAKELQEELEKHYASDVKETFE